MKLAQEERESLLLVPTLPPRDLSLQGAAIGAGPEKKEPRQLAATFLFVVANPLFHAVILLLSD